MYKKVDAKLDFVGKELGIEKFWKENSVFDRLVEQNKKGKMYSFYEGPPTANGKPHMGHVLTRTIKDVFLRYNSMKGYDVFRKGGWDTHGLPVELEVEKEIGSTGKKDIEAYGIDKFIEKCKQNVWIYKNMWQSFSDRMGYWVDTENAYITYTNDYIESVWWSLSELFKKGLVYKGHRIVPYCARCGTSLSSHEVAQGYKDVKEKSIFVKFKLSDEKDTYFLAWTTTPWTLPSNVALCMNAKEDYAKIKVGNEYYILAKKLISTLFKAEEYELVDTKKGKQYEFVKYEPLFDFVLSKYRKEAWFVTNDDYVTLSDGTGIVHIAPAFGEDDSKVGKRYKLPFVQLLDEKGEFPSGCGNFTGKFCKDADPIIIRQLKDEGKLLKEMIYEHSYPYCWRCDHPLLYYARSSWFVATTKKKEELIKNNAEVEWYPENIGEGRMGGFLKGLIDWDIARDRYWGTPLPFWVCKNCGEIHAVGSIKELKKLGGLAEKEEIDLHKPHVDKITFKCGKCGGVMERTPEVLDCWYDSGAMPFAQVHYPFENKELFEKSFPCEFISEGMDQTRGWFYSLLAVNTLLFGKSPYKRCLPIGLVTDEFGKKMSKSKGNGVDPFDTFKEFGTDTVRWYFYIANSPWLATAYKKDAISDCQRKFMGTLWNTYSFFVLYANIDKFDGSKTDIKDCKISLMDKWIISEFNSLVKEVNQKLEKYNPTEPARLINTFVDNLSNWYVRRSRERYWVSGETEDKTAAFATLYYILTGLTKLIAPFVPMIAEEMYQNLVRSLNKNAKISVHMCDYPTADEKLIDKKLNKGMESVLEVVVLGRSARNLGGIKNRQPLKEMYVSSVRALTLKDELLTLVKDELNVMDVSFVKDVSKFLGYEVKPQLKTLGPKYGMLINDIKEYLSKNNQTEIAIKVLAGGSIKLNARGTNIELAAEDLLINPISQEGFASGSANGITVVLDTHLTDELVELGLVREFVSKIQALRKEAKFFVTDHINISYETDRKMSSVIEKYKKDIAGDTLADTITEGKAKGFKTKLDINGIECLVSISKVQDI